MNESRTRAALIAHLNAKVEEADWAAVSAAADDLRQLQILQARSKAAPRPERQRRPGPLDA